MRNLLLLLLLANVLYFVWSIFADDPTEPGVAIVEESELGPPMEVTAATGVKTIASVGEILGSGEPSDLAAVVGRSCVTIGPIRVGRDAEGIRADYAGEGMRAGLRSGRGQIFVGHWAVIRNIGDRMASDEIVSKLHSGGLPDAFGMQTEEDGWYVSLVIDSDLEDAEKIELQAESLGFPADVIPFTREDDVFFVDLALPPGQGASAIVDRHGEDRVFLRDAATCPQSQ
jgi:hypothetical protein